MNRYPDYYHGTARNPDWERATRRDLPRDSELPYRPARCDCPRCEARRPLERVITALAWCGWIGVLVLILYP